MALKSLNDTFIYNHLNSSNGITNNIALLIKNGMPITKNQLEEPFIIISKNFKFPLKYKVLDAIDNGTIKLIFGTNSKLPTCLPFFLMSDGDGGINSVVPLDIYGSYDKDTDTVKIDAKKLYCIIEAAYLARMIYINQKQLVTKSTILSGGSNIYSSMFTGVLNKKYSLNIDKTKLHKTIMLSSKFYMLNILGLNDGDMIFNYAIKNCPNGNLYSLEEANDMFDPKGYTNIETFIEELKKPELGLVFKDLTVRGYLEAFINRYEASNLLSLESFPYFIYNINSVTNGGYINNQFVLEDIVGLAGSKIYNELVLLDR